MTTAVIRALAVVTLLALFVLHRHAPPDLSTPKATVHTFVDALMANDTANLAASVEGAKDDAVLKSLLEINHQPPKYEIKDIIAEVNGDTAKVAVSVDVTVPVQNKMQKVALVDFLTLKKVGEYWLIVPDADVLKAIVSNDPEQSQHFTERTLTVMAAIVGSPEESAKALLVAKQRAQTASCLSNGKQISLGLIMYVQDYDETYPPKKSDYTKVAYPYVKNSAIFTCPFDPPGTVSYSFNPHLAGVSLAQTAEPANTIMLYEGRDMKIDYKHDGRAMIAFADGHTMMRTPDQVKKCSWTPDGKPGDPPPIRATPAAPTKKPAKPNKAVKKPKTNSNR